MKKHSALFMFLFFAMGCRQDKVAPTTIAVCGKSDPLRELSWLKERVAKQTESAAAGLPYPFSIIVYQYDGKTVIADESLVYSSPYLYVFNCDGSTALQGSDYDKYLRERKEGQLLLEFDGKKIK